MHYAHCEKLELQHLLVKVVNHNTCISSRQYDEPIPYLQILIASGLQLQGCHILIIGAVELTIQLVWTFFETIFMQSTNPLRPGKPKPVHTSSIEPLSAIVGRRFSNFPL